MSSRKRRRRHFRDSKFKHFRGEHAPRLPQVWGAFGALTFLPLRAALKSPATLLTADYGYLIAYEINAQGWKKRLGLDGIGGGGCIFKIAIYCQEGVHLSLVIIFWGGGSFDTPHFSENPRPPLGRNKRSVPWLF